MGDFVGPICEVFRFFARKARRYVKYQRKFTDYVDEFQQARADLQAKEAGIQQQLEDELRFGKMPRHEVERWLKKVQEKLAHAKHVEEEVGKGKYLFHSCLGKLVDETTNALKEVHGEGNFYGGLVANDPSITVGVNLPAPEIVGATNVREEIFQYLMGDEFGLIGVWGMGGIGKTTIIKDIHNRLLKEGRFSKLIWVTVSSDFDIHRLQKSIARQLELDIDVEDIVVRAGMLSDMLRKQGRHLIILDDIWESFSLEDVGIPKPTLDNGCKLVLTTRSERVVESMRCKKVPVACLSMEESTKLFLSKVGQDVLVNPILEKLMKLVVKECGGLPLAIITMAGCMSGISNPHVWQNAVDELRGCPQNIRDLEDKVYTCIRFSYDHLKQADKDCFLCVALHPEDNEIGREEIIEHWIEAGLIGEMGTRKAMVHCGHSILERLVENCLLEKVESNVALDMLKDTHVKLHDLVRDMALHVTRNKFMVKAGKNLKELPHEVECSEDLEKVSLMNNCISKIPQMSSKFLKLRTLLLSHNSLIEIPESFFEHFPNLEILDLSHNPITSLPDSISSLEKLRSLLLKGCYALESLPDLSNLQALKKLVLRSSGVRRIPQGLERLANLEYLDLGMTECLAGIPTGVLSELYMLQYLVVHLLLENTGEITKLNKLEFFQGWFSNVGDWNSFAGKCEELYKYSIFVGPPYEEIGFEVRFQMWPLSSGNSVGFESIEFNSVDAVILPSNIQKLHLSSCNGVSSLNNMVFKDATDLKECEVRHCPELEYIFSSICELQTLEYLFLSDLANLKNIGEPPVGLFSSLKKSFLKKCAKMKKLFSLDWNLQSLEKIKVRDCSELEEILVGAETGGPGSNNGRIEFSFPKLKSLDLYALPGLKSICSENGFSQKDTHKGLSKVKADSSLSSTVKDG